MKKRKLTLLSAIAMAFTMMADIDEALMEKEVRRIAAKHLSPVPGSDIPLENVLLRRTPPKQAWVPPSYVAEGGTIFRPGLLRRSVRG